MIKRNKKNKESEGREKKERHKNKNIKKYGLATNQEKKPFSIFYIQK